MPMEIEKEMEVEGSTIRSIQRSEESVKVLDYDYKKCNGCGICVALCPVNAPPARPRHRDRHRPRRSPVLIDLDKCVFCGMCAAFCPVDAYRMTANDPRLSGYGGVPPPRLPGRAERALSSLRPLRASLPDGGDPPVVFRPTRDVFGPLPGGGEGRGKGR